MKKMTKLISLLALCGVSLVALTACQNNADQSSSDALEQEEFYVYDTNPYLDDNQVNVSENYVYDNMVYVSQEQFDSYEKKGSSCYQVKNGQIAEGTSFNEKLGNNAIYQKSPCSSENGLMVSDCSDRVPVEHMDIETPARCQIPKNASLISSFSVGKDAFKMSRLDRSDALPRFEVNGYTFKNKPLDAAIQTLVDEAGIKVFSDDALFPDISGDKIRGELSVVLDGLVSAGDVFYRYNASKKQLILSRWARFVLSVPGGRVGMYAVLDALRGANITDIKPDFGTNEIYMRLNKEKYDIVKKLTDTIMASPKLVMFDVQVYRLIKKDTSCRIDWQSLIEQFGASNVNASINGVLGRALTVNSKKNEALITGLKKYGAMNLISEGVAVMPDGWKVRFDIGQCTKFNTPEKQLAMIFQSNMISKNRIETKISLNTGSKEITSFHTMYGIEDNVNVIGIPGRVFNPAWDNNIEYVIVLTPRLLKLVK